SHHLCSPISFSAGSAPLGPPHSFPTRRSSDLKVGTRWAVTVIATSALDVFDGQATERQLSEYLSAYTDSWRSVAWPSKTSSALRSEEHTSELQSLTNTLCRLLLSKKKTNLQPT